MKAVTVLSLFDGSSGGYDALNIAGVPVSCYYASEVDKYPMAVSAYNHPDIHQVGDVRNLDPEKFKHIDLLIGGSPCTNISVAGKQSGIHADSLEEYLKLKEQGTEFQGQSYLIWEYIRILRAIRPKFFFLENVRMKKEFLDKFNAAVGLEPTFIDSNLVSAQNRKRYYWFGVLVGGRYRVIPVEQPEDREIMLADIIHENRDNILDEHTPNFNVNPSGRGMNGQVRSVMNPKSGAVTTNKGEGAKVSVALNKYIVPFDKTLKILDKEVQRGKVGYFRQDSQANRIYHIHDKAITLCGAAGGGAAKMGQYLLGCMTPDRVNKKQNGQRFNTGRKFYTLTMQDRHGVLIEGYIRKLTPIECERLQTMKDNSTEFGVFDGEVKKISDARRYAMIGNGWTHEAVAHQFKYLKPYL